MRKALDVGEARFELRQNFESAFRVVFGVETFGDLLRILVRTSHVSDWSRREHMELIRRDTILTRASFQNCAFGTSHSSFFSGSLGSAFSIGFRGSI